MDPTERKIPLELLRLTRQCRGIDKYVSTGAGLSIDEMHCISALFSERPESVSRLSELISVSPTRASRVLKSLEQRGLVTRSLNPVDHRREQVVITEKGIHTVQGIFSLFAEAGNELLGSWRKDLAAASSQSQ